mmetsp:Transcript_107944/g.300097  ORF Transcript_107944/g.300097 Transcript_107944/m.300097 type:complete len:161 (+) Transcript_107944:73-555(+)
MSGANDQSSTIGESSSNTRRSGHRPSTNVDAGHTNTGTTRSSAPAASAATTMTITETQTPNDTSNEVLPLTLRAPPSVRWDEDVIDNEGLGRKSSKRCCIFHKQRDFGESSTDSSDDEGGKSSDSSSSSGGPSGNSKPIARKKIGKVKPKKVPDFQRFHA